MKYFYPRAIAQLKVVWENFGSNANIAARQTYELAVMPRSVRVNVNSYAEADTFELELDYKVFPFDPRTIRSCQVSIFMDNGDALPRDPLNPFTPSKDNAVFEGFADEDQMSFSESTRSIKLKGRDFTALYIDAKWPGTLVSLYKPVNVVIEEIIRKLQATGNITVSNRTGVLVLPTLAAYYPNFGQLSGNRSAKKNEKYWDVIQDICSHAGLICYMELNELVIAKPRTLFDRKKSVQFVYGKNLKSLEMTRKFGRQKGFNVIVRSVVEKEVIEAKIPLESINLPEGGAEIKIPKQGPNGVLLDENSADSTAPYMSFSVANVRSKAHLIEVGEKIFEEIGRQQIEGKFQTSDMDAPSTLENGISVDCFNLLKLRVATPLKVVVASDDLESISKLASVATRIRYLTDRGYNLRVATIFAQTLGKFDTPFYTKSVQFSLDATNGFRCDVDFLNNIEKEGLGI